MMAGTLINDAELGQVQASIVLLGSDAANLAAAFRDRYPNIDLRFSDQLGDASDIEAAVCWRPPTGILGGLTNLRLIQSSGAGVDHLLADPELPPEVTVCRASDDDMGRGMAAYVCWAVVSHQRQLDDYADDRELKSWHQRPVRSTATHTVGILGTGNLGSVCAQALTTLGYPVRGWRRRSSRPAPHFSSLFQGREELESFLRDCHCLVCLLPLASSTRGFLSSSLFAHLQDGTHLINVGRGEHLIEADLFDALSAGSIAAATLDTFIQEPLPREHPFWGEPRIRITPHIATRCTPASVADQTLRNLLSIRNGRKPQQAVDPLTAQ
ncbi:glyoxylate/hydroxypyruvate reductase A [Mesorhizobium sp. SB112]|uniref:2-hydroxyacid dehydrogenase n=1 Tax=Mesorhizobium sp. SB112 TaxID=3151853 RepID=UPI0032673DE2